MYVRTSNVLYSMHTHRNTVRFFFFIGVFVDGIN